MRNPPTNAGATGDAGLTLGWEDSLEEEMAPHSSILASEIPRTEKPGGCLSMGSQKVRHGSTHVCSLLGIGSAIGL